MDHPLLLNSQTTGPEVTEYHTIPPSDSLCGGAEGDGVRKRCDNKPVLCTYTTAELLTRRQMRIGLTLWIIFLIIAAFVSSFSTSLVYSCNDFCDPSKSVGCLAAAADMRAPTDGTSIHSRCFNSNNNNNNNKDLLKSWRSGTFTFDHADQAFLQTPQVFVVSKGIQWNWDSAPAPTITVRGKRDDAFVVYEAHVTPSNPDELSRTGFDTWHMALIDTEKMSTLPSEVTTFEIIFDVVPIHGDPKPNSGISVTVSTLNPRGIRAISIIHIIQFVVCVLVVGLVVRQMIKLESHKKPLSDCDDTFGTSFQKAFLCISKRPAHVLAMLSLLVLNTIAMDPLYGVYIAHPDNGGGPFLRWLSAMFIGAQRCSLYLFIAYCLISFATPWDPSLSTSTTRRWFLISLSVAVPCGVLVFIDKGSSSPKLRYVLAIFSLIVYSIIALGFVLAVLRYRSRFMWKSGRRGVYHNNGVRRFALWVRFSINLIISYAAYSIVTTSITSSFAVGSIVVATHLAWADNIVVFVLIMVLLYASAERMFDPEIAPPNVPHNLIQQWNKSSIMRPWNQCQFTFLAKHNMSSYAFELECDKFAFDAAHAYVADRRSFFCWETAVRALNLSNEVYGRHVGTDTLIEHSTGDSAASCICKYFCCCCPSFEVTKDEPDAASVTSTTAPPTPSNGACLDVDQYGYTLHRCFLVNGIQVMLCYRPGGGENNGAEIVIAFRGTANVANVLTDLHATRVTWSEMRPYEMRNKVHAGIVRAWERIRFALYPVLADLVHNPPPSVLASATTKHNNVTTPWRQILVTGHSLGGALALMCSFSLQAGIGRTDVIQHGFFVNVVTYVFGTPAIGNTSFAHTYNLLCPETYRVENENDGISSFGLFLHEHVGKTVVVERDGNCLVEPNTIETEYSFLRGSGSRVRNHKMSRYGANIAKNIACLSMKHVPRTFCSESGQVTQKGEGGATSLDIESKVSFVEY